MATAPRKITVDSSRWNVRVRDDLRNGQIEYHLKWYTDYVAGKTATPLYPHPRNWPAWEDLAIFTMLDMKTGEPQRVGYYSRNVAFREDGEWVYRMQAHEMRFATQAALSKALADPAGLVDAARDTFDRDYGVETGE